MGRAERPLDPGPLHDFAGDLRALRARTGITYRVLSRSAGYSPSALSAAASGDTLPTLEVTLAYVQACGGDAAGWEQRWTELSAWLAASASGSTPESRTARGPAVGTPAPGRRSTPGAVLRRLAGSGSPPGKPRPASPAPGGANPALPGNGPPAGGGPPGGGPPDPAAANNPAEFVYLMRRLKIWAGDPGLRELEVRDPSGRLRRSTVSDMLRRDRLPLLEVVEAFIRACGVPEPQQAAWRTAWVRLKTADSLPPAPAGLLAATGNGQPPEVMTESTPRRRFRLRTQETPQNHDKQE